MITITGDNIWPRGTEHDNGETPSLHAIGVGLGRIPRFAGQTEIWYNVLSHTFVVADLVQPEHRIYALFHDAPEAIVGDVPTTWKTESLKAHETDLLERITIANGLAWPWPDDAWEAVHWADAKALAAEAHVLGHAEAEKWWPYNEAVVERAVRFTEQRLLSAESYLMADLAGAVFTGYVKESLKSVHHVAT